MATIASRFIFLLQSDRSLLHADHCLFVTVFVGAIFFRRVEHTYMQAASAAHPIRRIDRVPETFGYHRSFCVVRALADGVTFSTPERYAVAPEVNGY